MEKANKEVITITIDKELKPLLDTNKENTGVPISTLINNLLKQYFNNEIRNGSNV